MFLRQMELSRNRIGQDGALALVEALQQAPLVSLGLVENGLDDDTVARMMQLKPKMSVLHMSIIDTHASSVRSQVFMLLLRKSKTITPLAFSMRVVLTDQV